MAQGLMMAVRPFGSPVEFVATGGDGGVAATRNGESGTLYTFTASGDFTVVSTPAGKRIDVEIVAGGGGGSMGAGTPVSGGGGGAGRRKVVEEIAAEAGVFAVVVGAAGAASSTSSFAAGGQGGDSSAFGTTAKGGGAGGVGNTAGADGGHGGGGGGASVDGTQAGGATNDGGFAGGAGRGSTATSSERVAGGGGGEGGAAESAAALGGPGGRAGNGGDGIESDFVSVVMACCAGGGGAAPVSGMTPGLGGAHGGGDGAVATGTAATAGTTPGSGGGGGRSANASGAGYAGIVRVFVYGGTDATAPTLSSATDAADGETAATGSVSTTEGNGTLYWVVSTSATAPSKTQVKAGQMHTGAAAAASGSQAVSAPGAQNIAPSGLTAGTAYTIHFMHEDATGNQSDVASGDGFTTDAADPLDIALWQISGYRNGRVTMTRPGGTGPLILAQDGASDANQVGLTRIGSSMTNGLVRAEILIKGWDAGDTICGGAAGRLTGTNASANWSGYFVAPRKFSGSSRRVAGRKYTSGASDLVGTETTALPAAWADGTTHVEMELELAGTSITTRAKRVGQAGWEHEVTATDAAHAGPGLFGIFVQALKVGMSIEIHSFEVIPT